jgi:hypothetical protein
MVCADLQALDFAEGFGRSTRDLRQRGIMKMVIIFEYTKQLICALALYLFDTTTSSACQVVKVSKLASKRQNK